MTEILKEFEQARRILITGHINPDGDCVGAGLALMLGLNKLNNKVAKEQQKVVRFVLQDNIPSTCNFLEHSFLIETYDNFQSKYEFDLAIILDSGEFDRIGTIKNLIKEKTRVINIDHHVSNNSYGHINYINVNMSSTSEMIFNILNELNIQIDKDMGEALYVGLVNDTGNFSYTNVAKSTFLMASKLIELGVNNENIIREFYSKKTMARMKLTGYALENFEFDEEKKLTYVYLPRAIIEKYHGKKEDTEGIVEALRGYIDTEIALFIREEADGKIKGSLRSNGYDVNSIAKHFGGGGHIKAAGFDSTLSHSEIILEVKSII